MIARIVMLGCIAAASVVALLHASRAEMQFIDINDVRCDVEKARALIETDKRLGKPIFLPADVAPQVNTAANHVPTKQSMIVAVGDRLYILACGPNETWTPRFYRIDTEAERKFYNLAPPPVSEEPQKSKQRTRRPER